MGNADGLLECGFEIHTLVSSYSWSVCTHLT